MRSKDLIFIVFLINRESMLLGLAGDVMLGRLVNEVTSRHGYQYPWGNVIDLLKSTDLNLINLETTLTHSHFKVPKVFNFKATPDKVQCLIEANINIVNIANNHILDFSKQGLTETIATLDKAGIFHIGAGKNIASAQAPVIIQKEGLNLGFIGCTDNEPGWLAGSQQPGTHYVNIEDPNHRQAFLDYIIRVRQENSLDFLIVSLHWGPNQREIPSQEFQQFAHAMIKAGADIIHGHSAHVTQGVELYQNKLILYDTGDFVDDYMVGPHLRNDQSFLFLIEITKQGLQKLSLVPVMISDCQVNLAGASDYREMVTRMQVLSNQFGTRLIESQGRLNYKFLK